MGYYGWEALDFDEERDKKAYKAWLFDAKESIPITKPLDMWRICTDDMEMQWGGEALSIPGNKGWAWRLF